MGAPADRAVFVEPAITPANYGSSSSERFEPRLAVGMGRQPASPFRDQTSEKKGRQAHSQSNGVSRSRLALRCFATVADSILGDHNQNSLAPPCCASNGRPRFSNQASASTVRSTGFIKRFSRFLRCLQFQFILLLGVGV